MSGARPSSLSPALGDGLRKSTMLLCEAGRCAEGQEGLTKQKPGLPGLPAGIARRTQRSFSQARRALRKSGRTLSQLRDQLWLTGLVTEQMGVAALGSPCVQRKSALMLA